MGKSVNIKLGANITDFESKMKRAQKSFKRTAANLKSTGKAMSMSLTAPLLAFAGASVKAFDTQAKAEAKLNTALKGNATAFKNLTTQARELQKITIFGDEETIAAQSMLASMGLEEEAILRLTPLIQDMATAKGMDLTAAADLVAKSVGSSTNALSRYGIQIEGAVGSSERLESAAEALSGQFLGQSEAAAKAGAGGLKQLQNTLGDLMEDIGKMLIPILNSLVSWVQKGVDSWNNLDGGLKIAIVTFAGILAAIGPVLYIVGLLAGAFAFMVSPIGLAIVAIAALAAGFIYAYDNWAAIKERFSDVGWWQNTLISLIQLFLEYNPFAIIYDSYNKLIGLMGMDPIPDPFKMASAGLDEFRTKTKTYENEFGSFSDAVSNAANSAKDSLLGMGSALGVGGEVATPSGGGGGEESGGDTGGGGAIAGVSKLTDKVISLKDATKDFGLAMTTDFAGSLANAMIAGGNFMDRMTQVFRDIGAQIGTMIIQAAILAAIFSLIPGMAATQTAMGGATSFIGLLTGSLTGRANGGPIVGGQPYMVGENGPELFMSGQSGTIIPNGNLGGGGGLSGQFSVSGSDLMLVIDNQIAENTNGEGSSLNNTSLR